MKGDKQMSDRAKSPKQDNRPTNEDITPSWEKGKRRMANMPKALFDKKQRKLGVEPV